MSKIDDMLDGMVQEILKDKLKAIAEQRASDILKNLSSPSMMTQQQELRFVKKNPKRTFQCPSNAMISLALNPPAEAARPGTWFQRVWEDTFMALANGPMPRDKLTQTLLSKYHDTHDSSNISSLLSNFINKKILSVSMPTNGVSSHGQE